MAKRPVNEGELLDEIRFGMDDAALIAKYDLSQRELEALFEKLVENGSVTVEELYRLEPIVSKTAEAQWKCSRCDTPLSNEFEVCPKCKVYVPKSWTQEQEKLKEQGHLEDPREKQSIYRWTRYDKVLTVAMVSSLPNRLNLHSGPRPILIRFIFAYPRGNFCGYQTIWFSKDPASRRPTL